MRVYKKHYTVSIYAFQCICVHFLGGGFLHKCALFNMDLKLNKGNNVKKGQVTKVSLNSHHLKASFKIMLVLNPA